MSNDTDEDGDINVSTVTIVNGPTSGTVNVNSQTGEIEYSLTNSSANGDSFTYRVSDAQGNVSNTATVNVVSEVSELSLTGFEEDTIISSGLGQPISLTFLPDNRMLVVQKSGEIMIADPNTGDMELYMDVNNALGGLEDGQERGVLDIALDPDFEQNGHFYLYYTASSPANAVIARFTHEENSGGLTSSGDIDSRTVLWTDTDEWGACCHYGGGLDFGPDDKLWLTTSDKFTASNFGEGIAAEPDLPLVLSSTSGKVIRINKDGTIPDGTDGWPANPFINDANAHDSVWAYGLRNPFRSSWDEEYGYLYMAEVGGNQTGVSEDDIHLASLDQAGAFYGWPFYESTNDTPANFGRSIYEPGDFPLPDGDLANPLEGDFYSSPIFSYARPSSVTGGFVYRGEMFPEEWDGVYFYGDYSKNFISYLVLDESGTEALDTFTFKPSFELGGPATNVVYIGEDNSGALYYVNYSLTGSGEVHKISYMANDAPLVNTQNVEYDANSLFSITFTADFSDSEGDDLTYSVNFGDGTVAEGQVVNGAISIDHVYSSSGIFEISLTVSDEFNTVFASPMELEIGDVESPPVIQSANVDFITGDPGQVVTFTANVSDRDTPLENLTYTIDFGDGTTPVTGSPDASGDISVPHTYSTEGNFSAFLEISDGTSTVRSTSFGIGIGDPETVPINDGLVLALEAYTKVGLDGLTVQNWLDSSGNGNNLSGSGDPQFIENATPSGQPAIHFDGVGDYLDRTDTLENFSSGSGARTIYFVVDYGFSNIYAGLAYGNGAEDEAFGLVLSPGEDLTVQAWSAQNDAISNVNGETGGFLVHSVVMQDNGDFVHSMNGQPIDSGNIPLNTVLERLVLGQEISGAAEVEMTVAAAFIWNRALTEAEQTQVEDYLDTTYFHPQASTSNVAPVAENDAYTGVENTDIDGNVLDNDSDANGDTLSVTLVSDVSNGGLTLNSDGTFSYTPDLNFDGNDTFTYEVTDGTDSVQASVTLTVNQSVEFLPVTQGLVAQFEADQNVARDANNLISDWLDGSGNGNDLFASGDPTLVMNATPTGQSAVRFDGDGDKLERLDSLDGATGRLNNLPSGDDARTLFFVADFETSSEFAGFAIGNGAANEAFGVVTGDSAADITVYGWGAGNNLSSGIDAIGNNDGSAGDDWSVISVIYDGNTITINKDGVEIGSSSHVYNTVLESLVIGEEISGLAFAEMDVAAALIYDTALTESDVDDVEEFLFNKYVGDSAVTTLPSASDPNYEAEIGIVLFEQEGGDQNSGVVNPFEVEEENAHPLDNPLSEDWFIS